MTDDSRAIYRCKQCKQMFRKGDMPTRYGIVECKSCLRLGYVGTVERVSDGSPLDHVDDRQ